MNYLFEVKIKYKKIDESTGKEKKVNETYILNAVSFTYAETIMNAEAEKFITGEFSIEAIKRSNVSEIINTIDGLNPIYKASVDFISFDENSGREKKTKMFVLLESADVESAYSDIVEWMSDSVTDYSIEGIVDSKIVNYIVN